MVKSLPAPPRRRVEGGDMALLSQSVAVLKLAFSRCGSRRVKFVNWTSNLSTKS